MCPAPWQPDFFRYNQNMPKSISVAPKKRGRPATGRDPITGVRLPSDLGAAVDRWAADQNEPRPSRSEVIRLALRDWLAGQGYLKHRDDPEGANGQ